MDVLEILIVVVILLILFLLAPGLKLIGDYEVGILTKKMFGRKMPQGQVVARSGEIGVQADEYCGASLDGEWEAIMANDHGPFRARFGGNEERMAKGLVSFHDRILWKCEPKVRAAIALGNRRGREREKCNN